VRPGKFHATNPASRGSWSNRYLASFTRLSRPAEDLGSIAISQGAQSTETSVIQTLLPDDQAFLIQKAASFSRSIEQMQNNHFGLDLFDV
jgi:hypothetical protein